MAYTVLYDNETDEHFTLEVQYEKEGHFFIVKVTDKADSKSCVEHVNATYEPLFGIDIIDLNNIMEVAEKLATKLERFGDISG